MRIDAARVHVGQLRLAYAVAMGGLVKQSMFGGGTLQGTLEALDQTLLTPSMVDSPRAARLRERFRDITSTLNDGVNYRLEFRSGKGIGPNAFALPAEIGRAHV